LKTSRLTAPSKCSFLDIYDIGRLTAVMINAGSMCDKWLAATINGPSTGILALSRYLGRNIMRRNVPRVNLVVMYDRGS
jgi:hypothetical protein